MFQTSEFHSLSQGVVGDLQADNASNEKHLADLPAPVPSVNQIEVHPWLQQRPITEYCDKHNIRVIAFCPLVRAHPDRVNDPVVVRLGEKYGKTWAQIIIRWSLQKGYALSIGGYRS